MANTLTDLIPDVYAALDVVSREQSGFILASTFDASAARVAIGQTCRVPIAPAAASETITPGQLPPDTGDQNIENVEVTIEYAEAVPFRWNGEESAGLNNGGPGRLTIQQNQIAQAIRTLVNRIEATTGAKIYKRASRAVGTAGTSPFAANMDLLADGLKVLKDNGCPENDLHCIINTTAGNSMRKLSNLYKANEAGSDDLLRQGELSKLHGFSIRESNGVATHTKGTSNGAHQFNGAGAVGDTTINLDTGTGTIVAGDVLSFANGTPADANKYVVNTALAAGSLKIGKPGLQSAHADNDVATLSNNYAANMLFHRSAIVLVTRKPYVPAEGDMADDAMEIRDERTGLVFELRMYKLYRRVRFEIGIAWGSQNIKSEHTAILLG